MPKWDRFRDKVLSGQSDNNIDFSDLVGFLKAQGFDERIEGDHHILGRQDVAEIINLQPASGGKAKAYQVRQVRKIIKDYGI